MAGRALTVAAAVVVALTACGGGGDDGAGPASSPPPATEPAVTAPPTLTPEEQASVDIEATFAQLIAAWDDFKANAGEHGNEEGSTWNADLVASWPVEAQANLELTNWVAAWRSSELEQRGTADVRSHLVTSVRLESPGAELGSAESVACLDLSAMEFVGYDGEQPELDFVPDRYQRWTMTWLLRESGGDGGDWRVQTVELSRNDPC